MEYSAVINCRKTDVKSVLAEIYFSNEIQHNKNIKIVDMAFHAGAEWFLEIEKNDLLYELIERDVSLRILLNKPETAENFAKHMRHQRKTYISFEDSLNKWKEFQRNYPDQVALRVTELPILRRYYSFHMEDHYRDTVNVQDYTYANVNPDKNHQLIVHCGSEYFTLYREEFKYLWQHSELCI